MWRTSTCGQRGILSPCWGHLQPGPVQARLEMLVLLVYQTPLCSPKLLVDLDRLPPFLVHHHTWPFSRTDVLERSRSFSDSPWLHAVPRQTLIDKAQLTQSMPCFPLQNPMFLWAGAQLRMATVTLTAEIAAQIAGQQCDYTTPHSDMCIKIVSPTCSLPSAMKKAQLGTQQLDPGPEISAFHSPVDDSSWYL